MERRRDRETEEGIRLSFSLSLRPSVPPSPPFPLSTHFLQTSTIVIRRIFVDSHVCYLMLLSPLNMFQRLVRSWEAVHPYNAAQAMKLSGRADPRAVNDAWHASLAALGLGRVRAEGQAFGYEILNGDADRYPVRSLAGGTCLAVHLSDALNTPFDDPREPPFRPFLLHGDGTFHLGVVYQHWVADSASIRMLLREWCARLYDPKLSLPRPARPTSAGYWDLYGSRGQVEVDRGVLNLFRNYIRFRTVQKVCMTGVGDYPMRVVLRELPVGLAESLRSTARRRGIKVGDILLATLAQASHRHVPLQLRPSRRDLAIGNIVDLRSYAGRDMSETFGLFLGFNHVVCSRNSLNDFPRLIRSVSLQTGAQRREGMAQSSLAWMIAALVAQRFVKPKDLYRFYRKEIPLAGGLSNVNLTGSWAQRLQPSPLLDYLRISPTGPMVPLVLSVTTLGSCMSLALTYRPALLDQAGAQEMAQTIIDRLVEVSAG
jgi:hypothetical protein